VRVRIWVKLKDFSEFQVKDESLREIKKRGLI